jgi:hypothetical protein
MKDSILALERFWERLKELRTEIDRQPVCTSVWCRWNKEHEDYSQTVKEFRI